MGRTWERNPLAMLGDMEMRTVTAPASGGGPSETLQYVFGQSIADFVGIARPRVPGGVPVHPSIISPSVASTPAAAGTVADSDATLRGELLTPSRVQATSKVSREDIARFPDMGRAIAVHLSQAVGHALDVYAIQNAARGLLGGTVLTLPLDGDAGTDWADFAALITSGIDGRGASLYRDVRVLVHPETFAFADKLFRGNNTSESVMERINRVAQLRVSDAIDEKTANDVQRALIIKGPGVKCQQPIWGGVGVNLIDPYSSSDLGEIRYTAVVMSAFSVQATDRFAATKFDLT